MSTSDRITISAPKGRSVLRAAGNGLLLLLAFQVFLGIAGEFLPLRLFPDQWIDAAIVLTATLATVAVLLRELPAQNVLFISGATGLTGGILAASNVFGPSYAPGTGLAVGGVMPWFVPLVWFVIIVNARLLARRLLRPWRTWFLYGFLLVGVSAALACLLQTGIDAFGVLVREYWHWPANRLPGFRYVVWALSSAILLIVLAPWFISKRPAGNSSHEPNSQF
jgi:uncharacterized membrane protein